MSAIPDVERLGLTEFNEAAPGRLRPLLTACLDVPRWVEAMLNGRPYADVHALVAAAEASTPLTPEEVHRAMRAHPRIGERAGGWSRGEQSGVDDQTAKSFREANAEYERHFGHVFLVCAGGREGAELLANLRARMTNDPATEIAVAGTELVKIAKLRLGKAVHEEVGR